jgi:hypothetical protein
VSKTKWLLHSSTYGRIGAILFAVACSLSMVSCTRDDNWEANVKKYIQIGMYEPASRTFQIKMDADKYISKFALSTAEIQLVGSWYVDRIGQEIDPEMNGPGIEVALLPNRILKIYTGNDLDRSIEYILGLWKVEGLSLQVRLTHAVVRIDRFKYNDPYNLEVNDVADDNYHTIFWIRKYKNAYVNREPFNWTSIPKHIRENLHIKNNDQPRYRSIEEEMISIYDVMGEKSPIGRVLLNVRLGDKEYMKGLCLVTGISSIQQLGHYWDLQNAK